MNFISPVDAVDSIWIEKMPSSKPVKVSRAVTVGRVTLMVTESGRLYSPSAERVCYTVGSFGHHEQWFRALRALGVLTKEQVQQHKEACDKRDEIRKAKYAAIDMERAAKVTGLPLTKAQREFVRKYGEQEGGRP